jgi:hypothetical protein
VGGWWWLSYDQGDPGGVKALGRSFLAHLIIILLLLTVDAAAAVDDYLI